MLYTYVVLYIYYNNIAYYFILSGELIFLSHPTFLYNIYLYKAVIKYIYI